MARLLVLWLLSERSSYGYEIKKALGGQGTALWFRLDDASIYSALRTLTKHGQLNVTIGEERLCEAPHNISAWRLSQEPLPKRRSVSSRLLPIVYCYFAAANVAKNRHDVDRLCASPLLNNT